MKTAHNNVFASSGVDASSNVFVSLMRSVSGTGRGFGSTARTQILTLVAIGAGQICVPQKRSTFY